jgi:hypothetical protein
MRRKVPSVREAELIAALLLRWMDHDAMLRGNRRNGRDIRPLPGAFAGFVEGGEHAHAKHSS